MIALSVSPSLYYYASRSRRDRFGSQWWANASCRATLSSLLSYVAPRLLLPSPPTTHGTAPEPVRRLYRSRNLCMVGTAPEPFPYLQLGYTNVHMYTSTITQL
jgi:hypothetical protein